MGCLRHLTSQGQSIAEPETSLYDKSDEIANFLTTNFEQRNITGWLLIT